MTRVRLPERQRDLTSRISIPREQLMEPALWNAGDAGENIGEPGQRIDVVKLRRHDERRHHCGPIGTAFGAGK
jgi:hypothetical protein